MNAPVSIPATKRIVFMLGWDTEKFVQVGRKPTLLERWRGQVAAPLLGENKSVTYNPDDTADLDLACYVFDKNKKLLDMITPGIGRDINDNESIYHSGDQETGRAGAFDEELFIDLAKLPANIQSILIYIRVDADVDITPDMKVKLRVMNATDTKVLLNQDLPFDQDKETGCIVGQLSRNGSLWTYTPRDVYLFQSPDGKEEEMLGKYLS